MKTLLTTIAALLPLTAPGAIVASYQFDTSTAVSVDTDPDSTAGDFAVGSGINGGNLRYSTFAYVTGTTSASMLGNETNGTDEATTIAANDYWTFTVTATTGVLNLDQLTFNYGGTNGVDTTIFIRSSVGGFGTSDPTLATIGPFSVLSGGGQNGFTTGSTLNTAVLNFSTLPAYQNLSSITFRIYGYDTTSSSGAAGVRLDNVNLTTIPEPSSTFLALTLIPAAFLTRKRRP